LRLATTLVAALAVSGCATAPHKTALQPIAGPQSFEAARALESGQAEWPSDGWWKAFGDGQLDSLIAEGLGGATDIRVAQARFDRAQAIVGQARSQLLPSINASAEGGLSQQSDNYLFPSGFAPRGWPDYGQASLSLNWELDFWGKNRAALAAAKADAQAAQAEAAATRLTVAAGIANAYADLAGYYAELDAAQDAVRVRGQTHDLIVGRRNKGLENDGAVQRAASSLASAQGQLAALEETIALTRNRIAALMGAGPDRGLTITRPMLRTSGVEGLPANIPAELIGRRPDIIAARLTAEAAASRIKQARAAFYPNINLTGLIGMQAMGIDKIFKSGSDYGSVAPALSLPIFDGGRLRANYRGSEADYQSAVAQYDGTLVQALREVADAAASQRALSARLDRAQAAERAAQAAWTVANNRYRGGLATYLDVLTAEDTLISTRQTVASLQTRVFSLDIALIRSLGGGFRS